jgi:predicted dehydrogenase
MNVALNVAIVGCGLIGTQWDADAPPAGWSLTHANGFSKQPQARLAALCDQDLARAQQAAQRWGAAAAFDDPQALFRAQPIDIAVVAASSAARWSVVEPALAAGVKVLVIEKPLATTLAESRRLAQAVAAAGVHSIVNFSRRWDPAMRELRDRIHSGGLGAIQRFNATYGKGISNNGSHMIDLVGFLCGGVPRRARALGSPLPAGEADWCGGKDRALDAQVEYADAHGRTYLLTMLATDQRAFTAFELRVVGEKGLFDFRRGGRQLAFTPLQDDPQYAGYVVPGEPQPLEARLLEAMDRMADEAVQLAQGALSASSCDVLTALRTALTVEAINISAREQERWVDLAALDSA